jgi:hypothetical protein
MLALAINHANDARDRIKSAALEVAISTAVKKSDPSCNGFVGVFVARSTPKSKDDSNWVVQGIRYGTAQRDQCEAALSVIVARMKQEFEVAD